jgi:DNA-binding response OmpR family regulator
VYKILLVEDDVMIREAFSIVLQLSGQYDVTTAENGQVAITLCTENTYDLILLDIMMPVLDGPGFLKEYATRWPDVATKVVIMSNLSSGSELSIARDYGVDRSVLKSSLTPGQLLAVVADVLDAKKKRGHRVASSLLFFLVSTSANEANDTLSS